MDNKIFLKLQKLKEPKFLVIFGIVGILLIALPSFFQNKSNGELSVDSENFDCDKYLSSIEDKVKDIVLGITGDRKATVVVTLENGIRYSYADDTVNDTNLTSGEKTNQSSKKTESSHITVQTSSGDEKALIVTAKMPEIRGVAVICDFGDDDAVNEKITSAVTAALDITSKRVFVSGKN